ncbi:MAG: carbohydrate binding domain-containing protein [Candidatus Theseobacter exili]|nr:carbohydrate binding domain-containing protein [Candidatus Theseobacter exili]
MNKNCFKLVAGIVLTLILISSSIYAAENLIRNGGFEDGKEYFSFPEKGVKIVTENPHSGKTCLLINPGTSTFTVKGFKIKPNTTYTLSFWYRTDKTSLNSSSQVFTSKQTSYLQHYICNNVDKKRIEELQSFLYPSTQWREVKTYFYSRDNTEVFINFAAYIPFGNLYIDDLILFPRTDDEFKGNLITNGEFEEEFPYHWSASRAWRPKKLPVPPVPAYFLDKESGFQMGKKSLRIDCKEKDGFWLMSQYFPIRNGKSYTCSFWMKSNVEWFPVYIVFCTIPSSAVRTIKDYNNPNVEWFPLSVPKGTMRKHFYKRSYVVAGKYGKNWKKYEFEITIPDKKQVGYQEKICISLWDLYSLKDPDKIPQTPAGSLWIDKVEVYEVEE